MLNTISMEPVQSTPDFTAKVSPEEHEAKFPGGWKKWLLFLGLAVIGILAYVSVTSPMLVTVTGNGEVSVPATNATISFTLSAADATSPEGAIVNVKTLAGKMRTYLISRGIAEGDIAESVVTAVPAALVTPGGSGYQATISMAAKTVHVTEISTLVSDLYSQGAYVVAQPVLSVENQDSLSNQAFDSAVKDADAQAKRIGLLKWKFIRKIVSVSLATSPSTSTSTTKADTLTSANDPTAAANGVFKIAKAVSVTYKMW